MIRVLHVEDQELWHRFVSHVCDEISEITVEHCFDLTEVPAGNWDLILLDLQLQTTHGLRTAQKCRELFPDAPIVVLSATADQGTQDQLADLGVWALFSKGDTSPYELMKVMQEAAFLAGRSKRLSEIATELSRIAKELRTREVT